MDTHILSSLEISVTSVFTFPFGSICIVDRAEVSRSRWWALILLFYICKPSAAAARLQLGCFETTPALETVVGRRWRHAEMCARALQLWLWLNGVALRHTGSLCPSCLNTGLVRILGSGLDTCIALYQHPTDYGSDTKLQVLWLTFSTWSRCSP